MERSTDKGPFHNKPKPKRLSIRRGKGRRYSSARSTRGGEGDSCLPPDVHRKIWGLFSEVEREFEKVYLENVELHEKIDVLTAKCKTLLSGEKSEASGLEAIQDMAGNAIKISVKKPSAGQLMSQKLKTTYKVSTSKIVSSLKIPNQAVSLDCHQVQEFCGHKDGIWEATCSRPNLQLLATASADRTARIWHIESGQCLAQYVGHNGSVNSARFHPADQLICTGAGDGQCHIWKTNLSFNDFRSKSPSNLDSPSNSRPCSGDDEQEEDFEAPDGQHCHKVKSALMELSGHEGPVVSADWWGNGKQIFTASWDRTIKLWDAETAKVVHTLEGHEMEITHACSHPIHKLIVSSSQDTTFRLWDFRLPNMHSVNVFQGHSETVTSAVFTNKVDHVVSGSDDRTVKVWDLKNMRAPLATINLDSAVNRLSISPTHNVIAIPHDNRQVRLFDLNGNRLARLPRRHRQGHRRMVCCTAWYDDCNTKSVSLLTAGFDKRAIGWNVMF
eukprot:gene3424-3915_t